MTRPGSCWRDPGDLSSAATSTTRLAQCILCLAGHASTIQRQLSPTGGVRSSPTRTGAAGTGGRSSGSRTRVVPGSLLAGACAGGGRRPTVAGTERATTCGSQHWLRVTELDDAYAGVVISNVNATMSIIRFAAVTPGDIADGVVPGGGGHVPEPAAESVGSLLRTMHHPLPLLDFGNASFEERGVFHRWTGMAKGPVPGYSALTLSITGVEFDVEWSFFL